jgi:hypothetical protein
MKINIIFLTFIAYFLSACTAIQVNNNQGFETKNIKHICIIKNNKVTVPDFENIIIRSLARYNIKSEVYPENSKPLFCEISMTYTALRTWDVVTYLSSAQFNLYKDHSQVAEAKFHLRGKGGLALNKWRSTETKVNELVDELLK